MVKILCGLYSPTAGKILVDGGELAGEELQAYFAVAFQDIHMMPMSAAENVAFGEAPQREEAVKTCLDRVGLGEVFQDVYTPVTKLLHKEGLILSGGQEQRLVLARTLYRLQYKGAFVALLDEPTAALDPLSEQDFYRQYEAMTEGRTAVLDVYKRQSSY